MKTTIFLIVCLLLVGSVGISVATPAQEELQPKKEKVGALAFLPAGAGPAMVGSGTRANIDIDIHVNS